MGTRLIAFGLIVLASSLLSSTSVCSEDTDGFLPIGLTEEEKGRLHEIGKSHRATDAPPGELRNPAEWEPSVGVIIRWPLGISVALVREMSEDLMVTTIVANSSEQTAATNAYQTGGVVMANTQFLVAPTNSIWTRDYGPWFIFADNDLAIVDHIYNRPRPLDDVIPQALGAQWGLPVYGMDLIHTGGNHMSDGLGRSMSTRLVYNENPGKTPAQVDSIMLAYLGNAYTVLDYIESGGIHHIDCWAKFLNPTTILVKDVPVGSYSYNLLNARAEYLSQQISAWGQPYTIVRIYCPTGTAYTNSIILNNKVLVPIFGSGSDNAALQTYRDAMPGYEVIGFTGSWYDDDAIHCRTMGVPDQYMLRLHHVPLVRVADSLPEYEIGALIQALSGADLIDDSVTIIYQVDGEEWTEAVLSADSEPDWYGGSIPGQSAGSIVSYYIKAADVSGRVETHPYIGEPWAHRFSVNVTPTILADASILCTGGSSINFCPSISDADDTTHLISYANYPLWLTVSGDCLSGTVPQGFTGTESFDVFATDGFNTAGLSVHLQVILCGDVNGDSIGPDLSDLIYLVNYLFNAGPEPPSALASDINGSGGIDLSDLIYLVNVMFNGGPAATCGL